MARAHVLVALLAAAAGYALLASSNQTSQLQVLLLNSVKDQPWLAEAVETLSLSVKRARLELDKLLGKTSDLVAQVPQNAVQDTLTASCKLYGKVGTDWAQQACGSFQAPTDMSPPFLNAASRVWL
jgi:hypothetical protein